jgi:hypothetical protein
MSLAIVEELTRHAESKQIQATEDFEKLASRVAADENVSVKEAAKILEAAGKTAADLEAATEGKRRRLALLAKLARIPGLLAEQEQVQRKISEASKPLAAAEDAHRAARVKHDQIVEPLAVRVAALQSEIDGAPAIRAELRQSYAGPLLAELAAAHKEANRAALKIDRCIATIESTEIELRRQKRLLAARIDDRAAEGQAAAIARLESTVATMETELAGYRSSLPDLNEQLAVCNREAEAIETKMGNE